MKSAAVCRSKVVKMGDFISLACFIILMNGHHILGKEYQQLEVESRNPPSLGRFWAYRQFYHDNGVSKPSSWYSLTSKDFRSEQESILDTRNEESAGLAEELTSHLDSNREKPLNERNFESVGWDHRQQQTRSNLGPRVSKVGLTPSVDQQQAGANIFQGMLAQHENPLESGDPSGKLTFQTVKKEGGFISPSLQRSSLEGRFANQVFSHSTDASTSSVMFIAIVSTITLFGIFSVAGAGYCFYRIDQRRRAAADVDYPAYGICGPQTKPNSASGCVLSPTGDRKLAQSAQMYHYHHQKQHMIASEKIESPPNGSPSDGESDEENEEGDYTVYECPGLASTGELEVKNPLFQDDLTPVSTPTVNKSDKA